MCQDFAHVMIAMCRSLKVPARYVSGYLYNGPKQLLRGAQASHAWCEVYVPGVGWRGLDPTNGQPADERYVKVATGRDYADVPPVRGRYRGTAEQRMQVEVDVQRTKAEASRRAPWVASRSNQGRPNAQSKSTASRYGFIEAT